MVGYGGFGEMFGCGGFGVRLDPGLAVIGRQSGLEDASGRTVSSRAIAARIATRARRTGSPGNARAATPIRAIMAVCGLLPHVRHGVGRIRLAGPRPLVPLLLPA